MVAQTISHCSKSLGDGVLEFAKREITPSLDFKIGVELFCYHNGVVKRLKFTAMGSIPTFIEITHGKVHDVNILDLLISESGTFYDTKKQSFF